MQIIELYINNTRVDLFNDESVSITDSIQNVRDISKIYTAFSKQFNLPASKTNNKLFKHYYNYEIDNGFDARYKASAEIKLNGVTYKTGKIRLNSVDLKDNAPYSYKVVFFGDTVELKDQLAELLLSSLDYDSSMDFTYNATNIWSRFTSTESGAPDDVVVPLITHSKRFEINASGEYKELNTTNDLDYIDVKPAVRVKKIIEAIESSGLGITFSSEFFNSEEFNNLYLWLHKNEGYISNADEGGSILQVNNRLHLVTSDNSWSYASGTEQRPLDFSQILSTPSLNNGNLLVRYQFVWTINTTSSQPYTPTIQTVINGQEYNYFGQEYTGNQTFTFQTVNTNAAQVFTSNGIVNPYNFLFKIQSTNTFSMTQSLEVRLQYKSIYGGSYSNVSVGNYNAGTNDVTNTFRVGENMPKIKVFDFLINLFKMFNLTVFKRNDELVVEPLQDFYNAGKRYDITEYVDMSKSSVSKLLQFKNILLKYKSKKSQLVQFSDEIQSLPFSQESYGNDAWDGGNYNVEVDFEKMMYERLFETDDTTITPMCQGAMIDKKFEPTIGQPLLLYIKDTDPDGYLELQNYTGTPTNYKRPSQIFENASNRTALNFGQENDEFQLAVTGRNLFETYYQDYIVSLFDIKGRKLNVSAYLPLHIILRYNLNDRFIINGRSYKINTIKTNLLTNKSDLELITELQSISELENGINPNAPRVAQPTVTTKDASSITLTWTAVSGVTGYKLYVDDAQVDNVTSTGYKFSSLESGTTYKLGVQASYTNFDARITDTFETTD
jgi:hypothetical protein